MAIKRGEQGPRRFRLYLAGGRGSSRAKGDIGCHPTGWWKSLQGGLRMVNKNPPKMQYTTLIEKRDEERAEERYFTVD